MKPECFPQPTLDPVAVDGFPDRSWHGKPKPRLRLGAGSCIPRKAKSRKQRAGNAETFVINQAEFGGAKNPGRPGKGALTGFFSWLWRTGQLFRR